MINFTVGPVQSSDLINQIGSEQVPYFRTDEFSKLMIENERLFKKFLNAPENSKVVFITGSGTASMEAVVSNTLSTNDKVLIINGGSFGQRFCDLCDIYKIPYDTIKLEFGKNITLPDLEIYDGKKYTALLVNMHETSSGVLYDMQLLSDFCKKNKLLFIVDAISSFLADPLNMDELGIDIVITSSQKALACPPGISTITLSEIAIKRVYNIDFKCMYLNIKLALENSRRGQTPFTPAVGILRQINARLNQIEKNGGVLSEIQRVEELALYFREKIKDLPFQQITNSPSNAITSLHPTTKNAHDIFIILKEQYNIWICPNGGNLKDQVFRVGHIGNLEKSDFDHLVESFKDMQIRGLL